MNLFPSKSNLRATPFIYFRGLVFNSRNNNTVNTCTRPSGTTDILLQCTKRRRAYCSQQYYTYRNGSGRRKPPTTHNAQYPADARYLSCVWVFFYDFLCNFPMLLLLQLLLLLLLLLLIAAKCIAQVMIV